MPGAHTCELVFVRLARMFNHQQILGEDARVVCAISPYIHRELDEVMLCAFILISHAGITLPLPLLIRLQHQPKALQYSFHPVYES